MTVAVWFAWLFVPELHATFEIIALATLVELWPHPFLDLEF